jgi:hypothetical protein
MATTPGRQTTDLAAAFATTALSQDETAYFAALGRMIAAYAGAEAGVQFLARYLSGLSDAKARAVFGGMRLPDLTDRIRQMMRIDKRPKGISDDVEDCLAQLNVIAKQRHKLVHRMVEYAGSHLSVSNALTAKSLAAIEADVFSERDLRNTEIDSGLIFLRLLRVVAPDRPYENPEVEAFVRGPWRYRPPQQASRKKQGRKTNSRPQPIVK